MLSADLMAHISERISSADQVVGKLEDEHVRKNCDIVNIQVVTNDFNAYDHILDIQDYLEELHKINIYAEELAKKGGNKDKMQKLKERKSELKQLINERRVQYYETLGEIEDPAACAAFVTFRSQEGMQRALKTYYVPLYKRILFACFPCCFSESFKELMFQDQFLNAKRPNEPT